MRTHRIVSRALLFAGVSGIALAVAAPTVRAADVAVPKAIPVAAPVQDWRSAVSFWFEGGPSWISGGSLTVAEATEEPGEAARSIQPKWGFELAAGWDYRLGLSPWHLSWQARYGQYKKSESFSRSAIFGIPTSAGSNNTADEVDVLIKAGVSATHRETHWLSDFAVGRDVGLGLGRSQLKVGLRVAEIRSRHSGSGRFDVPDCTKCATSDAFPFMFERDSSFIGIGPRIGFEGTVPIGGNWAVDWLLGGSILTGQLRVTQLTVPPPDPEGGSGVSSFGFATRSMPIGTEFVPNVDAQIGLGYWIAPTMKLSASYRFDGYWGAVGELTADGVTRHDRFYQGVMFRLTMNQPEYAPAPAAGGGIFKAPPPVAAAPAVNWTGLYVGAHLGVGWGRKNWIDTGDDGSDNLGVDVEGGLGGLQIGYNYQLTPSWVIGVEGDYSWADIHGDGIMFGESEPTRATNRVSALSTLTARLGYAAGRSLWYVKGGAAWARDKNTESELSESESLAMTISNTRTGWTIGAGVEYAWWSNWSLKAEYNYMDFGTKSYLFNASHRVGDEIEVLSEDPVNINQRIHAVKLGLNYRFNLGKAVTARY